MSNIFDMEIVMSRLSFGEKMLYAQLVGLVVGGGFYIHFIAHQPPGGRGFHVLVLVLILLFASFRTLLRRRSGNVVEDERDRSIAAIGTRWSNVILWIGLVAILVAYWDHGALRSQAHMIGIVFHLLVLAALVRIIRELVAYRTSL
jgi:multisubunit Na+/H+ antiporter MnhB subunit